MKLRILAALLALLMLTACGGKPVSPGISSSADSSAVSSGSTSAEPAGSSSAVPLPPADPVPPEITPPPEPVEQYIFGRDDFPRLNGSTSTVPLGKAVASVLLGETQDEVSDLINFSKTTQSYRQLMYGHADLLIAAEPAAVIWEEKKSAGFEWEMSPFAVDGLVFIVNADNPVDNLTTEQVRKIYSGEITNWSQVGGDDLEIVPFQRNAEAGSQTAMLKLVMKDLPMMAAPAEYIRGEMGDLIESVAAYDGTAAAIGYTVYYYANDMRMADGLKILSIDGINPCDETIRSGAYPHLNNYYALTAAGLPEDAPAKIMYDWLLGEDGQRLVAHMGYVSVLDVPEGLPSADEAALSPVAAQWDALTRENEASLPQPLYVWCEPRSADGLLAPRDDYGVLLPYVGTVSTLTNYIADRMPLFGLVTADGRVVTEPVYAEISFYDPFLILSRGEGTGSSTGAADQQQYSNDFLCTVAAADGSWARDVGQSDTILPFGSRLLIARHDRSILILNANGSTAAEFPKESLTPVLGEDFRINWESGYWLDVPAGIPTVFRYDDAKGEAVPVCWLDIASGTVLTEAPKGWDPNLLYAEIPWTEPPTVEGFGFLRTLTDPVTGLTYYYGYNQIEGRYDLLDETLAVVWEGCDLIDIGMYAPYVRAGLLATMEDGFFCYRTLDTGTPVFRWPIRTNSD